MTKYYFYSNKTNHGLDVVWDVKDFAKSYFNPDQSEFTGIMVEAATIHEAHAVYETPSKGSLYFCDEPNETASLRSIIKELAKNTSALKLVESVAILYLYISRTANEIKAQYNVKEDVETVFEAIKNNVIQELTKCKYGKTS